MKHVAFLLLLPSLCLAQQDNSVQSQIILNVNQPGTLTLNDRFGSKITITVLPDVDGPVKVDAMLSCQAAINATLPTLDMMVMKWATDKNSDYWRVPMQDGRLKLQAVKTKLDAIYPPP